MVLETKETGDVLLAKILEEEANLEVADKFKAEMFALIDAGHTRIALDFEEVTYVDSSFLGAMVASLKYAMSKQADIFLIRLQKDIDNMLQLIRMDKVFKIHPTLKDII